MCSNHSHSSGCSEDGPEGYSSSSSSSDSRFRSKFHRRLVIIVCPPDNTTESAVANIMTCSERVHCPECCCPAPGAATTSEAFESGQSNKSNSSGSMHVVFPLQSSSSSLPHSHHQSSSVHSINSKELLIIHNSSCQKSLSSLSSSSSSNHSSASSCPAWKGYRTFSRRANPTGWRPFLHLLLGLVLLLSPKFAMSSPLRTQDTGSPASSSSSDTAGGEHVRHQRPAKWINPCRIPTTIPTLPADFDVQQQSDVDIFQNIITQVSKAEHQAREFMPDFFEESFGLKLEQERDKFKDLHQDWIADVAKRVGKYLGEEVDPTKLEELTVEETLRSMYEGLQKFAVGLEQIVLDQAVYGGNYHQHFHEAEFQLKYVLCELQIAMLEKSIPYQDITREIMSQSYRDLDSKTARDIRDWLIFRDYVNVLEYLKQVFKHFLYKANNNP